MKNNELCMSLWDEEQVPREQVERAFGSDLPGSLKGKVLWTSGILDKNLSNWEETVNRAMEKEY